MKIKGYSPVSSPDGQYIAYQGCDGNCYAMRPDGSEKKLLWNMHGYEGEFDLVWSPDSQYVFALIMGTRRDLCEASPSEKEFMYK